MHARRRRPVRPDPKIERRPDGWWRSHLLTTPWLALKAALMAAIMFNATVYGATHSIAPPITAEPLPPVADEDVRLLAATAWAEARSEGELGMRAVAHVIVNRVGPRFGEDVETVVLRPWQFSAWNRGDPNRPLAQNPERYARGGDNLTTWITAQKVAREVLEGRSIDPTRGALFYHTRAVRPYWARYGVGQRTIGAHIFYSDVRNAPVRRRAPAPVAPMQDAIAPEITPTQEDDGRVSGVLPDSI